MRFPSFEPIGEPQEPVQKNGIAHIPSEARKKILRVLQGDLLKRNREMPKDIKNRTLETVIDFEESDMELVHGKLVDPRHISPVVTTVDLEKPQVRQKSQATDERMWQDTTSPEYDEPITESETEAA